MYISPDFANEEFDSLDLDEDEDSTNHDQSSRNDYLPSDNMDSPVLYHHLSPVQNHPLLVPLSQDGTILNLDTPSQTADYSFRTSNSLSTASVDWEILSGPSAQPSLSHSGDRSNVRSAFISVSPTSSKSSLPCSPLARHGRVQSSVCLGTKGHENSNHGTLLFGVPKSDVEIAHNPSVNRHDPSMSLRSPCSDLGSVTEPFVAGCRPVCPPIANLVPCVYNVDREPDLEVDGNNILDDPDPWSAIGRLLNLDTVVTTSIPTGVADLRTHDRRGVGYTGPARDEVQTAVEHPEIDQLSMHGRNRVTGTTETARHKPSSFLPIAQLTAELTSCPHMSDHEHSAMESPSNLPSLSDFTDEVARTETSSSSSGEEYSSPSDSSYVPDPFSELPENCYDGTLRTDVDFPLRNEEKKEARSAFDVIHKTAAVESSLSCQTSFPGDLESPLTVNDISLTESPLHAANLSVTFGSYDETANSQRLSSAHGQYDQHDSELDYQGPSLFEDDGFDDE
jgi:hypothetical protein